MRTNFLCNVLDAAHYSCRASRKQDAVATEERMNARDDIAALPDSSIVSESYPAAFFDALAMAVRPAIAKPTVWDRSAVANTLLQQYHRGTAAWAAAQQPPRQEDPLFEEEEHGGEPGDKTSTDIEAATEADIEDPTKVPSAEPIPNPWNIPLVCPTEQQLQQLLLFSLATESRYLPKLFRRSSAEHRASFYEASKTAYCWVDVDAFLLSSEWHKFIVETFSIHPPAGTAIESARKS